MAGFSEDRQVDFDDWAVEAKDGLEVGLGDVAGEIGDDDDLCVRLVNRDLVDIHLNVGQWAGRR